MSASASTGVGSSEAEDVRQAAEVGAEYLALAQAFFNLVEQECGRMKSLILAEGPSAAVHQMPALISLVNCVGYFRGQDGMFREAHPPSIGDLQTFLYKMEDAVEKQLEEIIQLILASEPAKQEYKERLMNYFVRSRCGEKPSSIW